VISFHQASHDKLSQATVLPKASSFKPDRAYLLKISRFTASLRIESGVQRAIFI
jgi:hypothetical protein